MGPHGFSAITGDMAGAAIPFFGNMASLPHVTGSEILKTIEGSDH